MVSEAADGERSEDRSESVLSDEFMSAGERTLGRLCFTHSVMLTLRS